LRKLVSLVETPNVSSFYAVKYARRLSGLAIIGYIFSQQSLHKLLRSSESLTSGHIQPGVQANVTFNTPSNECYNALRSSRKLPTLITSQR